MAVETKTNLPTLVALDVGFGETKGLSVVHNGYVIPSTVVPGRTVSSKLFNLSSIDRKKLIVTTEDGTFFVGENAMTKNEGRSNRTQISDRANDVNSRVLFQTGLALGVPDEDGEYDVVVVTGLPNKDYMLSYRDELEKFLSGSFNVTFSLGSRDITKKINIVDCTILRQPEGSVTFNQFEFDPSLEGLLIGSEDAKEFVGVIDIGHFTTDYALFQDGVIIEDDITCGSTVATEEVYNRLRSKLTTKFNEYGYDYTATDKDLDRAVRRKTVWLAGEEHDVSEEVDESAREVARIVAKSVLDAWGNETNRLEQVIVTGGGAHIFSDALLNEFKERKKQGFVVLEKPQLSNVIGFYMFGCLTMTQSYATEDVYKQMVEPIFGA